MPTAETSRKRVTITDVAKAAGVTKATVSKVFNGKGRISPVTIRAVRRAARRLNFEPNPHAQRLSSGRCSDTIALFSLQVDLGVNIRKFQIIQGLLAQQGYEIPAYTFSTGIAAALDDQATAMMRTLRRQRPRAIICTPHGLQPEALGELEQYQAEGGLVVCYDTPIDIGCDKVVLDRDHSSYLAAKHLLELGHRKIGFGLPGSPVLRGGYLTGFQRALKEYGADLPPQWMFGSESRNIGGGLYEEGGAQQAQKFLQLRERPTAICIADDYAAVAFAAAVQDAGVRIPEELSLIGHDDSPIARYGSLKLTTITHPVETIAHHVVDLVRSRVEGTYDGPNREVTLYGALVSRATTIPLARKTVHRRRDSAKVVSAKKS